MHSFDMTTPPHDPEYDTPVNCPVANPEKARAGSANLTRDPARGALRVQEAAPSIASHAAAADAPADLRRAPLALHNPHFERIGGAAGVVLLVERFYHHMNTLPEAATILAMHPPDLGPVKAVLVRFLTEWTGGPQLYSRERGHPRLRRRHLPFSIGAAERDAWITCMTCALADTVADAGLREQLTQAFLKTANFLRNDEGTSHDHHRNHAAQEP
jgi:hemoglobin